MSRGGEHFITPEGKIVVSVPELIGGEYLPCRGCAFYLANKHGGSATCKAKRLPEGRAMVDHCHVDNIIYEYID